MNICQRIAVLVISTIIAMNTLINFAHAADAALQPVNLRCEYLTDPLGIDETSPRLGWMLESSKRGDHQSAYRILVASSADVLAQDHGDLWDTGKVESDENAHVVYAGKPLTSETACFWKVQVWSALTVEQPQWSAPAHWTMGLIAPGDWQAKWIDSSGAVMAETAKDPVTIVHASYQAVHYRKPATTQLTQAAATTQPGPIDVTSLLASQITNGMLSLTVNNKSMGGDPALDKKKELVVEYKRSGEILKVTIAEDAKLTLPPVSTQLWYLRKSFDAKKPVKSAMLYATALGVYELHLNGQRVGDQVLAPGWTDYNKRLRYQVYDVTPQLKTGANVIGAETAVGWYAGHLGNGGFQQYGSTPALLAELHITYADGSVEKVITDQSWKIHQSPVLSSDFMQGETHDAGKEIAGWSEPALSESGWTAASLRSANVGVLEAQVAPPVRQTGVITPVKLTEPSPGHWTYDLGQNMVGVVRLKVTAPAGTVITLHHAEMLKPDGTVYTTNLRGAPSVDVYTCKGGGVEVWQPQFTFHGFRYVQVTGLMEKPPMDLITGIVLGSDTPRTGSFVCSEPRINQLVSNIEWGQRGNYLSVPTDCPQRDERLGWMGDAQVFVRTATCDADVAAFFTKWLVDVDDAQTPEGAYRDVSPDRGTGAGTPAWGDAGVICPWTIYMAYGDKRILEKHLPNMARWVDWCRAHSTNLIRDRDRGGDYGDWLSIKADTPKEMIGTAYFAYTSHLVAQSYEVVGNKEKAATYLKLYEDIKSAFNKKYVTAEGRVQYTDAKGKLLGDTQCCYAMALKFDLLPDELRAKAAQYLADDIKAKDWHLSTGFVGVSYLLPTLTHGDHADVAYKLLMQDSFPSWLFSVKHGATTIWERWDGWTPEKGFQNPGMNSFNHYSLGSCGEWLYDTVAGITWDPAAPGYKHVMIQPVPPVGGELTSAKGTIGSNYGSITSGWIVDGSKLTLSISLPPNTTATVHVPVKADEVVTESGKPADQAEGVKFLRSEPAAKVYEVQSGNYVFGAGH